MRRTCNRGGRLRHDVSLVGLNSDAQPGIPLCFASEQYMTLCVARSRALHGFLDFLRNRKILSRGFLYIGGCKSHFWPIWGGAIRDSAIWGGAYLQLLNMGGCISKKNANTPGAN